MNIDMVLQRDYQMKVPYYHELNFIVSYSRFDYQKYNLLHFIIDVFCILLQFEI